jgi:hypothetical protein
MAYPGSPLYERAKKMKISLPEDPNGPGWIGYSQHAYESLPLPTETLASSEVLDFRDSAFNKYFSSPSFLAMIKEKFGQKEVDHIQEMLAIKIRRKHHDTVSAA